MSFAEFKKKWSRYTGKESSAYQEHFNDLCRLLGHPTPVGGAENAKGRGAKTTIGKTPAGKIEMKPTTLRFFASSASLRCEISGGLVWTAFVRPAGLLFGKIWA
jgi:hypothetical protein